VILEENLALTEDLETRETSALVLATVFPIGSINFHSVNKSILIIIEWLAKV
jgi:hypothetical protein